VKPLLPPAPVGGGGVRASMTRPLLACLAKPATRPSPGRPLICFPEGRTENRQGQPRVRPRPRPRLKARKSANHFIGSCRPIMTRTSSSRSTKDPADYRRPNLRDLRSSSVNCQVRATSPSRRKAAALRALNLSVKIKSGSAKSLETVGVRPGVRRAL